MSDSPPGISAAPHEDNLRYFDVTIAGPDQSPYEGESNSNQRPQSCVATHPNS